ncbi:hypothetical protein [Leifsonia sp. Leaf264]|uniref:hypothetical protein n=1 Tax=Leifsonia sp. Leaf264 TaxID=1736314 RepID=UPI0006F70169|nr:hypothetical protein [Leifsonia sp. Leaf264]KQP01406.1 hypothetical protein ASF30_01970 [Leifsonia sp. Leaf264]
MSTKIVVHQPRVHTNNPRQPHAIVSALISPAPRWGETVPAGISPQAHALSHAREDLAFELAQLAGTHATLLLAGDGCTVPFHEIWLRGDVEAQLAAAFTAAFSPWPVADGKPVLRLVGA